MTRRIMKMKIFLAIIIILFGFGILNINEKIFAASAHDEIAVRDEITDQAISKITAFLGFDELQVDAEGVLPAPVLKLSAADFTDGYYTIKKRPEISGLARPSSNVFIIIAPSYSLGIAKADWQGNFRYRPTLDLAPGNYLAIAFGRGPSNIISQASNKIPFRVVASIREIPIAGEINKIKNNVSGEIILIILIIVGVIILIYLIFLLISDKKKNKKSNDKAMVRKKLKKIL